MRKQLVIQLARFGDIIQTKRLILSLARSGEVHLCVDQSLQDLARIIYPTLPVHALPARQTNAAAVLQGAVSTLDALRAEHFDDVYVLNHAGLSRVLAAMFDPEQVRGYIMSQGQSLKSTWVRMAFRWMRERRASPFNLMDYWAGLAPALCPVEEVTACSGGYGGGAGLGVVLAGQNLRRSLPSAVLAPMIRALFERLNGPKVFLLGTASEQGAARELLRLLPARVLDNTTNLAGKTDWTALVHVMQGMDTMLSPDTGTIHLAAHLGVPVEGLFLSSAWCFETGPYGKGHRVWQACQDCSPCVESVACPHDIRCRNAFTSPLFLSRLQGKSPERAEGRTKLPGLLELHADFDGLGQIWRVQGDSDPWAVQRRSMRMLLAEYLNTTSVPGDTVSAEAEAAQYLYEESDWIFPRLHP